MAGRIRGHDWTATPLGPLDTWPQSLKTAVDVVLAMPGPATILWGPAAVQLYNDAYIPIAKDRHPTLLGKPVAEGWPEAYDAVIVPLLEGSRAGRATRLADFSVLLRAPGARLEERAFDMQWSPIPGESGEVAGALQTLVEVTDRRRAEAALLYSEVRLRALVMAGSQMIYRMSPNWRIMRQLDGHSVLADTAEPIEDWADKYLLAEDRIEIFAAIHRAIATKSLFELEHRVRQADGEVGWVLSRAVPILRPDGEIDEWFGAGIDVSARRTIEGRLREGEALLAAQHRAFQAAVSDAPLDQSLDPLVRAAVERLGEARCAFYVVEPNGTELRLVAGMSEGYAADVNGFKIGADSLACGLAVHSGEPVITPDVMLEPRWQPWLWMAERHDYRGVWSFPMRTATGKSLGTFAFYFRSPRDATPADRVFASNLAHAAGLIVSRHEEALERAHAEAALRESEERQAFLLTLSDALRALSDPVKIQQAAMELLAKRHDVMRAAYLEVEADADTMTLAARFERDAAPTPDRLHLSDYGDDFAEAFRAGRTLINRDTEAEAESDAQRAAYRAIGVRAWIVVPLVKERRLLALVGVQSGAPRDWTAAEIKLVEDLAERTWAAVERARAETALREAESRFRLIVDNARDYAIFTLDLEGRIDGWPPGAQAVFGWTEAEALGQPLAITFTPEDRALGEPEKELATAREAELALDVRWHQRKDGVRIFVEGSTRALRGSDGRVTGFLKIGQDGTARRATERALAESEARFRQFADASTDILWIRNADTLQFEYVGPAFERVYGDSFEQVLAGDNLKRWLEMIVPEDRHAVLEALRRVRAGEFVTHEFRITRPSDGEMRWIRNSDFPLRDASGRVHRIGGVGHDATEEKTTADRMGVMVAELQHRTRNLMGVVRSIANNTLRHSRDLQDFEPKFKDRLAALARVQGLLSRLGEVERITFDELITAEISALAVDAGRITLEGPSGVALRSSTVQTLAMALHELATNATKYGALTLPNGRLSVRWWLGPPDRVPPLLHVDWHESGMDLQTASASPAGRGSGRDLIERALPYQLGAKTRYEIGSDGVRCTIELPVSGRRNPDLSHV